LGVLYDTNLKKVQSFGLHDVCKLMKEKYMERL
jgi:hypothetical protein